MVNGCLKVTSALFRTMTVDEKLDCLFEAVMDLQAKTTKVERWFMLRTFSVFVGSMIGGALMLLVLVLLHVKVVGV